MKPASDEMEHYFAGINDEVRRCYDIAGIARKKGFDPELHVDIKLARNMAERVEGLISAAAPGLVGSGMTERIIELENVYSPLDWRVALVIAEEVANERFCRFKNKNEAMEVGIRVGFAYHTSGIVAAPLEGFVELKIKRRRDGKEYFSPCYAGPVRGAGGTAAAFSVILTDYIRVKMGYDKWDPTEDEIGRIKTEIADYHERVTNLQYFPSPEELDFLLRHLAVEVGGDPTEKFDVSNFKDIERIGSNRLRGGVCLVLAEGLSQKAPKLWKRLEKWGKEFSLDWDFLQDFLELKKKIHAKAKPDGNSSDKPKISPNYTFIKDLVAGRPVLTFPMRQGGFRLRYGRSRGTGFSAAAIHPATMILLDKFIATGTQLKLERPGKAASMQPCDSINGPIVRLKDGSVVEVNSISKAKAIAADVERILFLGDILSSYGDFSENGHVLVPCGYNEEWWRLELEKKSVEVFSQVDFGAVCERSGIEKDELEAAFKPPYAISSKNALAISRSLDIPLHPRFTYFWILLGVEDLDYLIAWLKEGNVVKDESISKVSLPFRQKGKDILEKIGLPHLFVGNEFIVIERGHAEVFCLSLGYPSGKVDGSKSVLENLAHLAGITIRDKAGIFIGARMGRPEKAKQRKMAGSPHVLFPVGEEGGRLRSFQAALEVGHVDAEFVVKRCETCKRDTIYNSCEICGSFTKERVYCKECKKAIEGDICKRHNISDKFMRQKLDIKHYFNRSLKMLNTRLYPELIKGVRGTSNQDHIPEHLCKGILRAKHDVYVNKDGTTRFDMTELPITHFRPSEIGTSIEKLHELAYDKDCHGNALSDAMQIVELKPHDIILPCGADAMDEQADKVLFRVGKFVDELLVSLYGLEPFYNFQKKEDMIGHLTVGLAPHISAGTVARIIGFSHTQGMLAHPLMHAALRRDCFLYDTYLPICRNGNWEISCIGDIVEGLNPIDVVDDFGTREVKVEGYQALGNRSPAKILNFTKHSPQPVIEIRTASGKLIRTTYNHKHIVDGKVRRACDIALGDTVQLPYNLDIPRKKTDNINLIEWLCDEEWLMVGGVNKLYDIKAHAWKHFSKREYDNYTNRDSYPVRFIHGLIRDGVIKADGLQVGAARDHVRLPAVIRLNEDILKIIGLYIAEGYSRCVDRMLYQVYIAAENKEIRDFVEKAMKDNFGLKMAENKKDRLTYSSRILYYLFTKILQCGSSAYEKRFPKILLNLPNEQLGHILSGFFEGDGSVSLTDRRVCFDTVSTGLLKDMDFVLGEMGIFVKNYQYTKQPGNKLQEFYIRKQRPIPKFTITKGVIQSVFVSKFAKHISFISTKKKAILDELASKPGRRKIRQDYDDNYVYDKVTKISLLEPHVSYCLNVEGNIVTAGSILTKQCDGDEAAVILLMDAFLNFSRQYLPNSRGAKTMDAPLVMSSRIIPTEVDDMVHGLDTAWRYPLELYEAALLFKNPWEVKVDQVKQFLNTERQYEGYGFTHDISNINIGVNCSAYKYLPSMEEKLKGQMDLAEKIAAVDAGEVAQFVIEKHFLKDTKGNLRKFSMQQFRCVKCNEKYRRPPLLGKCLNCGGKLIFTISEGSVIKYLEPSISLAKKYNVPKYLQQTLELLSQRVDEVFGKEKERQEGLGKWFG